MALDGAHPRRHLGQDRRGVARPGPDLEHLVLGPGVGELSHQRDDVRLRDGLIRADRQRAVLVGELGQLLGREDLAWHRGHRLEHARIAHAAGGDLPLDHALPLERPILDPHAAARPYACRSCTTVRAASSSTWREIAAPTLCLSSPGASPSSRSTASSRKR